uniref:Lipocalin/cytosolic fatty-acid binding domain-containing protein n=1 Tax=Eptatretus burgeri TaxID=7764 RepID=A0A8C4NEU7_EPTBU
MMNNVQFKGLSLVARTPHVTEDVMEEFNKAVVQANLANEEKFVFENNGCAPFLPLHTSLYSVLLTGFCEKSHVAFRIRDGPRAFCEDSKVHYEKTNCSKDPFSIDKYAGYWITIAISTDHPEMCKLLKKVQSSHHIVQRFAPLENAIIAKAKILINNGSCIKSTFMAKVTETSGKITPVAAVNLTLPSDVMTIFTDQRYSCIDLEYENYGFLTIDGIAADKTPRKMIYLVARKHQVPESALERFAKISNKSGISKECIVKFPNDEFCYEEEHVEKDQ